MSGQYTSSDSSRGPQATAPFSTPTKTRTRTPRPAKAPRPQQAAGGKRPAPAGFPAQGAPSSRKAQLAYPIRDGIPIMLIDEARRLDDK